MLTDQACKNSSCPVGKPRARYSDAGGLYLEISPAGSKRWFWKYYFASKEKRLALGSYPDTSLKAARLARDEARQVQQAGQDPAQERMLQKAKTLSSSALTFEAIAREFHAKEAPGWSEKHKEKWLRTCEKNLFPWIGALPIEKVTVPILLVTLQRVEARGAVSTAHDLRDMASQVFRHAAQTGRSTGNPAADLKGALRSAVVKHRAALLEPGEAGQLMVALSEYQGQPTTRTALVLAALVFQRPGNVRAMEWNEVDLDGAMWTIPAGKMKRTIHGKENGRPHFVPLAKQAVDLLRDLQPLTGHGRFVFPSLLTGERCMSDNTLNTALRRMGYTNEDMTAHGFRSMARTIIAERMPGISVDVIEAQLAHGKGGPLGMAYDRAEYMEQRVQLMQAWADYLDQQESKSRSTRTSTRPARKPKQPEMASSTSK